MEDFVLVEDETNPWCFKKNKLSNFLNSMKTHLNDYHQDSLSSLHILLNKDLDTSFITNYNKLFNVDDPCLCQTLVENILDTGKELGRGAVGVVYQFLLNRSTNLLILKSVKYSIPKPLEIYIKTQFLEYAKILSEINSSNSFNSFETQKQDTIGYITVKGDNFSNQTCLHTILQDIMSGTQFEDNIVYQYDAFYCGDNGYNIMAMSNGDLSMYFDSITNSDSNTIENMIRNILDQILGVLCYLKQDKYGFNHSNLKCKNVFVNSTSDGILCRNL